MPDLGGATVSLPGGTNIAAQGNPVAQVNPLQQLGGMVDTLGKIAQLRQTQASVAQTQMQIAKEATANLASDVASVQPGKTPDDPDVLKERAALVARGVATGRYGPMGAQIAMQYLGQGGFTDQRVKELAIQSGDVSSQEAQGMAPITMQNTGSALVPVSANPITQQVTMGAGSIPMGMTPAEARSPAYTGFDASGAPTVVLKGDIGPGGAAAPQGGPQAAGGVAPLGQAAPRVVGPPAGSIEAQKIYSAGQAQNAIDITQQMRNVPQTKATIDNMRDQVGEFAPGPQSPFWSAIGAFASQFGFDPSGLNKNLGTNAAAAAEEFRKLGVFVAGQQAAQAGLQGTDAQRAEANIGSPHDTMTPLGIRRMLGVIEGNADYQNAQGTAWLAYSKAHPGVPQAAFQGIFNQRYDPRVFQYPYLDKQAQDNMLAHMTAAQKSTFNARLDDARKRGLLGALGPQ